MVCVLLSYCVKSMLSWVLIHQLHMMSAWMELETCQGEEEEKYSIRDAPELIYTTRIWDSVLRHHSHRVDNVGILHKRPRL